MPITMSQRSHRASTQGAPTDLTAVHQLRQEQARTENTHRERLQELEAVKEENTQLRERVRSLEAIASKGEAATAESVAAAVAALHAKLEASDLASCIPQQANELGLALRSLATLAESVASILTSAARPSVTVSAVAAGVVAVGSRLAKADYTEHMNEWAADGTK